MKPYYYVYRSGSGHPPIVRHENLEQAQAESMRLSAKNPGWSFEILQCLGITRTGDTQTFWVDGVIPPHECRMNRLMDGTCGLCGKLDSIQTLNTL